jgi:hypothetical protein
MSQICHSLRTCVKCSIEKTEDDFYKPSAHLKSRHVCKECMLQYPNTTILHYCEICDITIRKKNLKKHLTTRTHLRSKLSRENNIHKRLAPQNLRTK